MLLRGVRQRMPRGRKVYHRTMDGSPDLTAFILAGGKSKRMGTDKALVEYGGRTLLVRALDLARSITSAVSVVGSGEKFAPFAPVVEDVFCDCGPLGGIHAALSASRTQLNLILAVDMPFVSSTFLRYLTRQAAGAPEALATVPRGEGGWQPLCAIYRREFAVAAEAALRAGRYRIDRLFDQVRTRVLDREELEGAGFSSVLFRNFNTPEQLEGEPRLTGSREFWS